MRAERTREHLELANASVTESAYALQALGVRDALNLDGGGTSAMWLGFYKVWLADPCQTRCCWQSPEKLAL